MNRENPKQRALHKIMTPMPTQQQQAWVDSDDPVSSMHPIRAYYTFVIFHYGCGAIVPPSHVPPMVKKSRFLRRTPATSASSTLREG